jgi:hypothetical protein
MEAAVMLVQVELLLMAMVLLLIPIALVPILMVTVGIPLLLEAVALPLLHVRKSLIVVITTIGKQRCNMLLPILAPLILDLPLLKVFAPPVGMCQPETPVDNLPPLTRLMVALAPVVSVMALMLVVNSGDPVATLKVCPLAPVTCLAVWAVRV